MSDTKRVTRLGRLRTLRHDSGATPAPAALGSSLRDIQGIIPLTAAGGAAILYVCGFLIVNVHLDDLEILRFDFVRARYIAAALLFFVTSILPTLVIVESLFRAMRSSRSQAMVQVTQAVLVLVSWVILTRGWERYVWLYLLFLLVSAAVVVGTAPSAMRKPVYRDDVLLVLNLTVIALLGSAAYFGTFVYPHFDPGVGGGAGWLARVAPARDTVHRDAAAFLSSASILIFDRDERHLRMLACKAGRIEIAEIPIGTVSVLQVRGIETVPEFKSRCRNVSPSGPRNANPRTADSDADQRTPPPR